MTVLVEKPRRKRDPNEPIFVYFIGEETLEYVKIGVARCPDERLVTLQIGNPRPLKIWALTMGSREDEAALHFHFDPIRLGGEWFRVDDRLKVLMRLFGADLETPALPDVEAEMRGRFGRMMGFDPHAMFQLRIVRRVECRMGPV